MGEKEGRRKRNRRRKGRRGKERGRGESLRVDEKDTAAPLLSLPPSPQDILATTQYPPSSLALSSPSPSVAYVAKTVQTCVLQVDPIGQRRQPPKGN